MESSENGTKQDRNTMLTLFLANTRSVKGKSTELQSLVADFDIICLTETHLDNHIPSSEIIPPAGKMVFRKDRTINGGGVMIAVPESLRPKIVSIDTSGEEMLILSLKGDIVLCCYYRPHVSLRNIKTIKLILDEITQLHAGHTVLFVGDMNFPDIDWTREQVKPESRHRQIHQDFLHALQDNNLTQLITQATHIKGNTLDLLCTNRLRPLYRNCHSKPNACANES